CPWECVGRQVIVPRVVAVRAQLGQWAVPCIIDEVQCQGPPCIVYAFIPGRRCSQSPARRDIALGFVRCFGQAVPQSECDRRSLCRRSAGWNSASTILRLTMDAPTFEKVRSILLQLVDVPEEEREDLLLQLTADSPNLRASVRDLLRFNAEGPTSGGATTE